MSDMRDRQFDKSIQETIRQSFPAVPSFIPQDDDRFECWGLVERLVQLYNKQRSSVIEQAVDAFNHLLLSHV